jgi:hypothetical protein
MAQRDTKQVVGPSTRHPKTTDKDLTRFRKAVGSIRLRGPVPSKKFLDDRFERTSDRARD